MSVGYRQVWDLDDPELVSAIDEAPLWSVPFGQTLIDAVALAPGLRVLDVGSGLGYPLLDLAQRLGPSCRAVGLDPWRAGNDRLRLKADKLGVPNVEVVTAVAEAMPFPDRSFDRLTSNNGLNNVADRARSLSECARVARPGAQLVITENLPETMRELYRAYAEVLVELGLAERIDAMHAQIGAKRKPLEQTRQLISASGFEIASVREHAFSLRYLDGTAMLGHALIRMAFLDGFQSILEQGQREAVFEVLERRLNAQAEDAGQLVLTVPFACFDCRRAR